jgi:class 3 adenylate cyclase
MADEMGASTVERVFRARVHPGLLVPHPHAVAVLAVDMRGFSNLTVALNDTQYLTDLVGEYLTELTTIFERHRGVVFQYTGDGLLGLFLPELAGSTGSQLLHRLVTETCPQLHDAFDVLRQSWRAEWKERGLRRIEVGLGVGLSYGHATIGFMGPSGKKQFGVIAAPCWSTGTRSRARERCRRASGSSACARRSSAGASKRSGSHRVVCRRRSPG